MKVKVVVIIYGNNAYLPDMQRSEGLYYLRDPFRVAALTAEDLANKINEALIRGNSEVPRLSASEAKELRRTVLREIGVRSWKELTRNGGNYSLNWIDDQIELCVSVTDEKGRWVYDSSRCVSFPSSTHATNMAQYILDDWDSRSE